MQVAHFEWIKGGDDVEHTADFGDGTQYGGT